MNGNDGEDVDEAEAEERERYETTISRHTVESSVSTGSFSSAAVEIDDGDHHHISADVDIEISGATPNDRPYTYDLLENIERAVVDEIRTFDGSAEDQGEEDVVGVVDVDEEDRFAASRKNGVFLIDVEKLAEGYAVSSRNDQIQVERVTVNGNYLGMTDAIEVECDAFEFDGGTFDLRFDVDEEVDSE